MSPNKHWKIHKVKKSGKVLLRLATNCKQLSPFYFFFQNYKSYLSLSIPAFCHPFIEGSKKGTGQILATSSKESDMGIPFGYRLNFTAIVSFILAYLWSSSIFPKEVEGDVLFDVKIVFTYITYIVLIIAAIVAVFKFLGRNLSQVRLPSSLMDLKLRFPSYLPISFSISALILFGVFSEYDVQLSGRESHGNMSSLDNVLRNIETLFKLHFDGIAVAFVFYLVIPVAIAFSPTAFSKFRQRLNENKTFRQLFLEGRGGSAKWASIASYEKRAHPLYALDAIGVNSDDNGHTTDNIILGKSLFDDDPTPRTIGIKDDAHMLTIGMTGSGKSTTVLLPNLAMYKGSAIVLDPKGELANRTYRRRSNAHDLKVQNIPSNTKQHMGGKCYVLDPFSEADRLPSSRYNLLSEIDINSDRVRELLSAISDGCVTPEKGDSKHFEELAKYFIEGAIAHVLSKYPKKFHHLPFVFDLVHGIDTELKVADPTKFKELLYIMMKNDAAGGLPQQVASKLLEMGDRERGSVLSTVSRSLKWIGDPAMRKHLIESDFEFSYFTHSYNPRTAYIVLPDGLIKEQMRWLRCLISVSIGVLRNSGNPYIPTLLILDEFPRLGGQIEAVAEGFGILRGYGIKLWAFIQDIGQLQKDYPDRWSSMTANSTVQVFGVNDIETAEWLSQNLGSAVHRRTDGREGFTKMYRKKVVQENVYPLLTPNEVMNKFGKTSNRQVVMPTDGLPMRLERLAYKPLDFSGNSFRGYPLQFHFEDY